MINALLLSLGQLTDRPILVLLLKVILITLLLLVIFGIAVFFGLTGLFSYFELEGGGFAAAATAVLIAIFAAVFLFRVIAMFVLNIFSDEIVDAVEAKHYPERAAQARQPGHIVGVKMGLASVGRAIGYNILALPIYVLLLFTAVGTPAAFFAVNALLIGRDLQDMIVVRHAADQGTDADEWTLSKFPRFGLGLITAILLAIPFVNFLAPILGAAMATHLVHTKRDESPET
ncbi:EI24 domain-containing protein [Parasphingorhabdus sp.]|uniref:EI24 domain-containing protein n=1 Tax=Parasphingorhabdus sp. TaxID=2709688 RepID=UPI003267417E